MISGCPAGALGEKRRTASVAWVLLGMAAFGCHTSRPQDTISESALPIVGGTEATTCQWPSTVMLIGQWVCTGTLVHPRAVLTAKHCVMDESLTRLHTPSMVGFGEDRAKWSKTVGVSRCLVHPDNDISLCILVEDVTDVPIVPVMAPCETSELLPGKPIVEVGFGVTGPRGSSYGKKKWIDGTIESRSASLVDIFVTTGNQDGEYFGDSGGPLFFRMPDQTWRLVGEDCCSDDISDAGPRISTYTSVPYHVSWLEEQSGLDLTPCHDMGGWNPDESCIGFPTNPGTGVGTWADMCRGEALARWQTCGVSPYDAGPRGDAREAGSRDGAREAAHDSWTHDLMGVDSSWDVPIPDGLGLIVDSRHTESDGEDTGEPVLAPDAASPASDTRMDTGETPDSAMSLDVAQASFDAAGVRFDTSAPDAHHEVVDSPVMRDRYPLADTLRPEANRSSDGATERPGLSVRETGCSCRTGAPGSAAGWPMLVLFGLARALRRRPRS